MQNVCAFYPVEEEFKTNLQKTAHFSKKKKEIVT